MSRDLILNGLAASSLVPDLLRWRLLRLLGLDIENCVVAPGLFVGGGDISIGRDCYINCGVFLDSSAHISIGARTSLGPLVAILTSTHDIGGPEERAGQQNDLPVEVGEGCWIGARCTILPGVSIGEGCVVAAGSVVASDCRAHGLFAGVPAVLKKEL
jgi:maltose O-acetyltransferase